MSAFNGKSVLVLGGSRGIGAAIVRRFVADGARVTFTYAGSEAAALALAAEREALPSTPTAPSATRSSRWCATVGLSTCSS